MRTWIRPIPMRTISRLSIIFLLIGLASCTPREVVKIPEIERPPTKGWVEEGLASWYGKDFHGRPTASGEIYNMYGLSAAHRTLPLGTIVRVTNLKNGRSVDVVINDRGPFVDGRIIDMSYGAARVLDMVEDGVVPVRVEALGRDPSYVKTVRVMDGGEGDFVVQVGAFLDPSNAERLRTALSWSYPDVYIARASVDGRTYYRVRLGSYKEKASALNLADRLAEEGYPVWVTRSNQ